MTCTEVIHGSLIDMTKVRPGGDPNAPSHFIYVPCDLPTTRYCYPCDRPVCRWHMVAQHDHTTAAQRKIRGRKRRR